MRSKRGEKIEREREKDSVCVCEREREVIKAFCEKNNQSSIL